MLNPKVKSSGERVIRGVVAGAMLGAGAVSAKQDQKEKHRTQSTEDCCAVRMSMRHIYGNRFIYLGLLTTILAGFLKSSKKT